MRESAPNDMEKYVAVPGHLVADARTETVLLHQHTGVYFGLNSSGRRIWELIQQPVALSDLVQSLVEEFDAPDSVARKDVEHLLVELVRQGLAVRVR